MNYQKGANQMNYSLLKSLVEDVCRRHNLDIDEVDIILERDFSTGRLSNIVVTDKRKNPERVVSISIRAEE